VTPETYVRACELDDDLPLDVCPGCGQDIAAISPGQFHRTPEQHAAKCAAKRYPSLRARVPVFLNGHNAQAHCEWTHELLLARVLRREWRLEYEEAHG
jgi:hypothetical protein